MPRSARIDYPGAIQHVCLRGIERRSIFKDDADRERFLDYLQKVLVEAGNPCLAWALMPNHVHLLMESRLTPLPRVMRRLGTCYATAYNKRHGRSGYLFQNRYYSKPVERDDYVVTAACYILRNPLTAGIVADLAALESYPWTGYPALLGGSRRRFEDVDGLLGAMGGSVEQARARLRARMADADATAAAWLVPLSSLEQVVPDGEGRGPTLLPPVPASSAEALRALGWDVERLVEDVCRILNVDEGALRAGRRLPGMSEARALVAHLGHDRLGFPLAVLGPVAGVTGVAMYQALPRGRKLLEKENIRFSPGPRTGLERGGAE